MKILNISKNKLYLEDDEIIDISRDIRLQFNLKKDMDITSIYDDILLESIKNKAIYLVSLKDRTEFELKTKLKEKYASKNHHLINDVMEFLRENDMVNDLSYATSVILYNTSMGSNKIRKKLMIRGIGNKVIDEAFNSIEFDLEDEQRKAIRSFIQKNNLEKEKLFKKLINKGYNYSLILEEIKAKQ